MANITGGAGYAAAGAVDEEAGEATGEEDVDGVGVACGAKPSPKEGQV